jgi:hypothetical protein
MSDSEFVTALHVGTGLVSQVPRLYVTDVYPHLYKELSETEVIEIRRAQELELYGDYITPAPGGAAAPPITPYVPVVTPETPATEGAV